MIILPQRPSGYTIFCDDVREEITGKMTFVGVYSGSLVVKALTPLQLPVLCCNVTVALEEQGLPNGGRLEVRKLYEDGTSDLLSVADIPEVLPANVEPSRIIAPSVNANITINVTMRMAPYLVNEEHTVIVSLIVGDDDYRLGGINVLTENPDASEA